MDTALQVHSSSGDLLESIPSATVWHEKIIFLFLLDSSFFPPSPINISLTMIKYSFGQAPRLFNFEWDRFWNIMYVTPSCFVSFFSQNIFFLLVFPNVFPKLYCYSSHNTLPYTQAWKTPEKLPIAGHQCVTPSHFFSFLLLL